MWDWLAKSPLGSAAKTFVAFVITAAVADWATGGQIALDNWETWVIGGLGSCIPAIVTWLNPSDQRWGIGSDNG